MPKNKYDVNLTDEERKLLKQFVSSSSPMNTAQCKVQAKVILCLDNNSENPLTTEQTAKKCKLHRESVYKIRKMFATEGIDRIMHRKKRETPPVPPKVTGEVEAHIIAIACSSPAEGRKSWTLQLIADKIVADGVVDSFSRETVRRTLKKLNLSLI